MQPKLPARPGVTGTVTRVPAPSSRHRSRWLALAAVVAGGLVTPLAPAVTSLAATTPDPTTEASQPTTPVAPAATTPATTPYAPPSLLGAASAAEVTWTAPSVITEESKFSLTATGTVNGQATGHIALVSGACPTSPLFPRQVSTGTRTTVAADPAAATPPATPTTPGPLGGTFSQTLTLTPRDSGMFHLCGWILGFPASSEASTVSRFDQPVTVANRPSTLAVELPAAARSGDYFTLKLSGTTPASGRRALIMADPDKGQSCNDFRKAPSGKRPLQSVVGLGSGSFDKTLRLRFRSKTAGAYLVCVQIVEINDRNPETAVGRSMVVTEGIKCVASQTALTQRTTDLSTVRKRRDAAAGRLAAAKKKVAPARAKATKQRKVSERRIRTAQRAVSKAKSKAGKAKARKRLAKVRKLETARTYRAAAPLRTATALVKQQERAYRQYRTGANLLLETITRTKKDLKKYCAAV